MSDKPPVGLRPRWLVLSDRADEIRAAMQRYSAQALLCPDEWLIELQDIERQQAILDPPRPEQPATPDFKPGQVWRTRKGMDCKIIEINDDSSLVRSNLYTRLWHHSDGKSLLAINGQDHEDDLVELIREASPEPELEPVVTPPAAVAIPRRFVSISRTVQANGSHTLDAIDDDGVAWWMVLADVPGADAWHCLAPLPAREVQAR